MGETTYVMPTKAEEERAARVHLALGWTIGHETDRQRWIEGWERDRLGVVATDKRTRDAY